MSGMAVDRDADAATGGHDDAVMDRDGAGGKARPVVKAEHPFHRKAVEQPGRDHRARAAKTFFRRLEDEVDRAAPAGVGGEQRGGAEQRSGMPVMAAGMHHAGIFRAVGQARVFGDRQRIHVGAQADAALRVATRQGRDDAVAADA
ncbi:hypothetical protein ACVWYI_002776 [Bradyrhizobium sp. LB13.1]